MSPCPRRLVARNGRNDAIGVDAPHHAVAPIGDIKIAAGVECQPLGEAEVRGNSFPEIAAVIAIPVSGDGSDHALAIHFPYRVIVGVGNIEVSCAVGDRLSGR